MANIYQGHFPVENGDTGEDGSRASHPWRNFPNGYGLHDVAGNVWEWVQRLVSPRHLRAG